MLTLTENAATVVKSIAGQNPDAETPGLRIATTDALSNELNLTLAESPEPDDQVVEADGVIVFLEPLASSILDDKILDARVEDNGSVSFAIGTQPL